MAFRRYYAPELAGKSLTKAVHVQVQAAFHRVFGAHCGWAHNALFISELASLRHRLPEHLRPPPTPPKPKKRKEGAPEDAEVEVDDEEAEAGLASPDPVGPAKSPKGRGTPAAKKATTLGRLPAKTPKAKRTAGAAREAGAEALVTDPGMQAQPEKKKKWAVVRDFGD